MKSHRPSRGFSTILVIFVLMMLGMVLLLLSDSSRDMLEQTSRLQAAAVARNLTASALAWAGHNPARLQQAKEGRAIALPVQALAGPGADLQVAPGAQGVLRVTVSVPCMPRPLRESAVYSPTGR
jgi:hypothetical protein